ncbi:MAG: BrnT family toxin [Anaerolineales bacterium]|nr:BrnT family toxin [Anaerolineales bacterium]
MMKRLQQLKKHGISFGEGATIFNDPEIATFSDPDYSQNEERFMSIWLSKIRRILTVIHTYRKDRIRLVSARKATKAEKKNMKTTKKKKGDDMRAEYDFSKSRTRKILPSAG